MIFLVIPCPDNAETSPAAWPPVTNYNLPVMEETKFLSEREGGSEGGSGVKKRRTRWRP